ncbi:hypothetical protein LGN17_11935 [Burkholderia sp. AU30280]|uniref:hypothetical protein n=1 Tax=unclassified Burkholderia TaxID=2613784 RepID=UPI001CF3A836|nr:MULTISPECIES: hypothetical protein [unclassified Burkholderia]MCA8273212.1 hypothetical protein [Burkholderia sp. AU30280]
MNAYTFATPFEKTAALAVTSVTAPSAVFFSPLHGAFSFQPPKECNDGSSFVYQRGG